MRYILPFLLVLWSFALSSHAQTTQKFGVGVLLPLSGDLAALGDAVANGMKLAVEEEPAIFGNVSFLYDDSRYEPRTTLGAFESSKTKKDIQIVYAWGSPPCMAIAPVAERERRPLVCFSGDPKPGLNYVMSFNNPVTDYAKVMVTQVRTLKALKVAVVHADIPFYKSLAEAVENGLSNQTTLTVESVIPSLQDFATIVRKLKAQNFQVVLVFLLPHQIPPFSKQLATFDFHPSIIGADTFSDEVAIEESKGVLKDAHYVDIVVAQSFEAAYRKKYGTSSNLAFAYNGYRFARMIASLVTEGRTALAPEELIQRLRAYASSDVAFRESKEFGQHFSFSVALKRVE